jgi:hypothetical protein
VHILCKSLQLLYVIFSFIFVWFEYTWGGLFHVMSRAEQAFVNLHKSPHWETFHLRNTLLAQHSHMVGKLLFCSFPLYCTHRTSQYTVWPVRIITPGDAIWPEHYPTQIETSPLLADIFLLSCRIITCLNLGG